MKTLLLLRHAKSDWGDSDLPDHDRPLNKRGKRDAPRMGQVLKEEKLLPDLIISSTAVRARTTAEAVAEAAGYTGEVETKRSLYGAEPEAYVALLRAVPDEQQRVLVVGHNPVTQDFLAHLTGAETELPTAALARVELSISSWQDLSEETRGELKGVWRPREL